MLNKDDETRGSEWRQAAERLATAMAGVVKEAASKEPSAVKTAASVVAPVVSGVATGGVTELGPVGAAVQSLWSSTQGLGGALGWLTTLNPVLGLLRLFGGGGGRTEAVELPRYEAPARVSYLGGISAESGWAVKEADYGAGWQARGMETERTPAQVTVQVQAMDSRSFLDHRDEIAAAVRQALLESHSLGDVMGER